MWNNGLEKKNFDAKQKRQAEQYRKLGMTEEQIKVMHEFDLEQYKSDRRFCMHNQPLEPSDYDPEEDDIEKTPLFSKFAEALSITDNGSEAHSRYWWIEEIDDPVLAGKLKQLPEDMLELLTLIAFDGYSQVEVAKLKGMSKQSLNNKLARLKKYLQ